MARIEMAQIVRTITNDSGTQAKMKAAVTERFKVIFNDSVIGMQKEFEEDPVTREIDQGIAADNISDTLGGGQAPDNLFAFIGFDENSHPTEPIRRALDPKSPNGPKLGPTIRVPGTLRYTATVTGPKVNAIYDETPIPWAPDMSWAEKIESGIPGFARFLSVFTKSKASHSGGGLQAKGDLPSRNGAEYRVPPNGYLSRIFSNFAESVQRFTRQRFRR